MALTWSSMSRTLSSGIERVMSMVSIRIPSHFMRVDGGCALSCALGNPSSCRSRMAECVHKNGEYYQSLGLPAALDCRLALHRCLGGRWLPSSGYDECLPVEQSQCVPIHGGRYVVYVRVPHPGPLCNGVRWLADACHVGPVYQQKQVCYDQGAHPALRVLGRLLSVFLTLWVLVWLWGKLCSPLVLFLLHKPIGAVPLVCGVTRQQSRGRAWELGLVVASDHIMARAVAVDRVTKWTNMQVPDVSLDLFLHPPLELNIRQMTSALPAPVVLEAAGALFTPVMAMLFLRFCMCWSSDHPISPLSTASHTRWDHFLTTSHGRSMTLWVTSWMCLRMASQSLAWYALWSLTNASVAFTYSIGDREALTSSFCFRFWQPSMLIYIYGFGRGVYMKMSGSRYALPLVGFVLNLSSCSILSM